jgi:hypothetical protein
MCKLTKQTAHNHMNTACVVLTVATAIFHRNHVIGDIALCTLNAYDTVQYAPLHLCI